MSDSLAHPPFQHSPALTHVLSAGREAVGQLRIKGLERVGFFSSQQYPHGLDFYSSDYLGLRSNPRLWESGLRYVTLAGGVGAGSARAVNQWHESIYECEISASQLTGFSSCTYLPSGTVANAVAGELVQILGSSLNKPIRVFLDHRSHSSLVAAFQFKGSGLSYFKHGDYAFLLRSAHRAKAQGEQPIVVMETLHSMEGNWANAPQLLRICQETGALLYLDEAHSFGICGPGGAGWLAQNPELKPFTLAAMFGCGKAVGVQGGLLATFSDLQPLLRSRCRSYLFTTGVSPFLWGAVAESLKILSGDEGNVARALLRSHTSSLQDLVGKSPRWLVNFHSPIAAFLCFSPQKALDSAEILAQKNFLVRPMRYPTVPKGTDRLRIILHASHQTSDIQGLYEAIQTLEQGVR